MATKRIRKNKRKTVRKRGGMFGNSRSSFENSRVKKLEEARDRLETNVKTLFQNNKELLRYMSNTKYHARFVGDREFYFFDVLKVTNLLLLLNKENKSSRNNNFSEMIRVLIPFQIELSSKLTSTLEDKQKWLQNETDEVKVAELNREISEIEKTQNDVKQIEADAEFPKTTLSGKVIKTITNRFVGVQPLPFNKVAVNAILKKTEIL